MPLITTSQPEEDRKAKGARKGARKGALYRKQLEDSSFRERLDNLDNTVVLVVSGDLPFAQGRFCTTEGIDGLETCRRLAGICSARTVLVSGAPISAAMGGLVDAVLEKPFPPAALVERVRTLAADDPGEPTG